MEKTKIMVTGGSGLIMSRVISLLAGRFDFISAERVPSPAEIAEKSSFVFLELTDAQAVEEVINKCAPAIIIHAAALTDVDACEEQKDLAWKINVEVAATLVQAAEKIGAYFIHFSTDFVFDGKRGNYTELDIPNPINYYGQTKYAAEQEISRYQNSCILRPAFPYRSFYAKKKDCLRWMIKKLEAGNEIQVVEDQYATPTFVDDLAPVIAKLVQIQAWGIYHITGSQTVSWYEAAGIIAEVFHFNPGLIKPIKYEDYVKGKNRAPRPFNSSLCNEKLKKDLNVRMSGVKEGVAKLYSQRKDLP